MNEFDFNSLSVFLKGKIIKVANERRLSLEEAVAFLLSLGEYTHSGSKA